MGESFTIGDKVKIIEDAIEHPGEKGVICQFLTNMSMSTKEGVLDSINWDEGVKLWLVKLDNGIELSVWETNLEKI